MTRMQNLAAGSLLAVACGGALAADLPNLALDAAETYRARAAFPEWSRPLSDAVDPVASARQATRQRMAGPNGAAPALEVWSGKVSYLPGDTVELFARLDWLGTEAGPAGLLDLRSGQLSGWQVSAQLIADGAGTLAEVVYRDDGRAPDALADDGIYSASLALDEALAPAVGTARNVLVKLHAENAHGDVRKAAGGFLYSHPGARLTGSFRQQLVDGNLQLLAETRVLTPGRYHLGGTLDNALGIPVATAQAAQQLEPGTHWMALPFYGLIFHQLTTTSGLSLGSITLTTANGMPNALGPVLEGGYRLAPPALDSLTSKPYGDTALLEAAARLEGQVRAVRDTGLQALPGLN